MFVVVILLAGCGGRGDAARLIAPGEGGAAGMVFADVPAGQPYVVGDLIICLDRPGSAVIDRVESIEPTGDLALTDFGVIPNEMERGGMGFSDEYLHTPIAQLRQPQPVDVVDGACADHASVALLLEYRRPDGDQSAGNKGIVIHYTSDGDRRELSVTWQILLCTPGDTTTPDCVNP